MTCLRIGWTQAASRVAAYDSHISNVGQLILVGRNAPGGDKGKAFRELAHHIGSGCAVVFIDHGVFREGDDTTRWAPMSPKGEIVLDWDHNGAYPKIEGKSWLCSEAAEEIAVVPAFGITYPKSPTDLPGLRWLQDSLVVRCKP